MAIRLVVGLGNPGKEYASHRHNVGFMAVDALWDKVRADPWREKFSGEIARAEIAAIKVCQNPWWYGWGIRWIRNGWLYNVSGREAIEITLTSGRRVRIGTDRATELAAALAPALG